MKELIDFSVRVNSNEPECKNYPTLLTYAVSVANETLQKAFEGYHIINVTYEISRNHTTMTDYCELVIFLSVPIKPSSSIYVGDPASWFVFSVKATITE